MARRVIWPRAGLTTWMVRVVSFPAASVAVRVRVWLTAEASRDSAWEKLPSAATLIVSAVPSTDSSRVLPSVQPVRVTEPLLSKKEPLMGEDTRRAGGVVSTEKLLVYRKASPWLLAPWKVTVWEPSDRPVKAMGMLFRSVTRVSVPPSRLQAPETFWSARRVTVRSLVG